MPPALIIEHLAYDPVEDKFDLDIFTAGQSKQDFSTAGDKLTRHIYDYVITDSGTERQFVETLDKQRGIAAAPARSGKPWGCLPAERCAQAAAFVGKAATSGVETAAVFTAPLLIRPKGFPRDRSGRPKKLLRNTAPAA